MDIFKYEIEAENAQKEEVHTLSYELSAPAFPETEKEAQTLAQEMFDKLVEAKPEQELSREEIYDWRIVRKEKKGYHTITAYLESTHFTIDLDFRDTAGDVIDPASKAGDDDYYGVSD